MYALHTAASRRCDSTRWQWMRLHEDRVELWNLGETDQSPDLERDIFWFKLSEPKGPALQVFYEHKGGRPVEDRNYMRVSLAIIE